MSNIMNGYFTDKVTRIRQAHQPNGIDPMENFMRLVEGRDLTNKFNIKKTNLYDLRKTVSKMKPSRSSGIDGISMKLIKDHFYSLEIPILNLVNQSIHQSIFPEQLENVKNNSHS